MAAEQGDRRTEAGPAQRIVVALDASPNSVAALRAAAELASWLGLDLEGLFVEDINLTRLSGFPNQQEVGSYTGVVRRLDDMELQRQLRALAASIQQAMAREAGRRPLRWTFQVRRGPVVAELLAASRSASMLSLGRVRSGHRRNLGSTALSIVRQTSRPVLVLGDEGELRSPLTIVYTGTEASERALRFGVNLQTQKRGSVRVLAWGGHDRQRVDELLLRANDIVRMAGVEASLTGALGDLGAVVSLERGTLVFAREDADLLAYHHGPAILIP